MPTLTRGEDNKRAGGLRRAEVLMRREQVGDRIKVGQLNLLLHLVISTLRLA
jgi:hypothetical protein